MSKQPYLPKGYYAVWAETELDGKIWTTNRIYINYSAADNLSTGASAQSSDAVQGTSASATLDKKKIEGLEFDGSRWSAPANTASSITYELAAPAIVQSVRLHYNAKMERMINTPKTIVAEVSEDGVQWQSAGRFAGPSAGANAYYGYGEDYDLEDIEARYVRLSFPDGAQGNRLDLMETEIFGTDLSAMLAGIDVSPVSEGGKESSLRIRGRNGAGQEISLDEAEISITSENAQIVSVDENGILHAGKEGRTVIDVQVSLNGRTLSAKLVLAVDASGNLSFPDHLALVQAKADQSFVSVQDPANIQIDAFLKSGKRADLSDAQIRFVFEDNSVFEQIPGTTLIRLVRQPAGSMHEKVRVQISLDGITLESDPFELSASGTNIALEGTCEVSSVRSRSGAYDGDDIDSRYTGEKAVDGDAETTWAAKQSDHSPWIQISWPQERLIDGICLIDRGHQVNEIGEGLLEFFNEDGTLVHSQKVENIAWNGRPENRVQLDARVSASRVRFTIDPDQKYYHGGSERPERGLSEFRIFASQSITENRVESLSDWYGSTTAGVLPKLPETLQAVLTDGTLRQEAITWQELDAGLFENEGMVEIHGQSADGHTARAFIRVKAGQSEQKADKRLLETAIAYANQAKANPAYEKVNGLVKDRFEKALAKAQAVFADEAASQTQVNEAWSSLCQAVHMLSFTADKTPLLEAMARAQIILDHPEAYNGDFGALQSAFENAAAVRDSEIALDASIENAVSRLNAAIAAMQPVQADLDYRQLELLIETISAQDLDRYVIQGQDVLIAALDQAGALNGHASSQQEIDAAVSTLHQAWLEMRLKADESLLAKLQSALAALERFDASSLSAKDQNTIALAKERIGKALQDHADRVHEISDIDGQELLDLASQAQALMDKASSRSGASRTAASVSTASSSGLAVSLGAGAAALAGLLGLSRRRRNRRQK